MKLDVQEIFFCVKARTDLAKTATLAPESVYHTAPITSKSASVALVAAFHATERVRLRHGGKTATAKWSRGTGGGVGAKWATISAESVMTVEVEALRIVVLLERMTREALWKERPSMRGGR